MGFIPDRLNLVITGLSDEDDDPALVDSLGLILGEVEEIGEIEEIEIVEDLDDINNINDIEETMIQDEILASNLLSPDEEFSEIVNEIASLGYNSYYDKYGNLVFILNKISNDIEIGGINVDREEYLIEFLHFSNKKFMFGSSYYEEENDNIKDNVIILFRDNCPQCAILASCNCIF